jgi:hypothetical protein
MSGRAKRLKVTGRSSFRWLRETWVAVIFSATAWLMAAAHAQEVAIAPQFEAARNFHRGVAIVKENGLWGLIDKKGGWVVRPAFEDVTAGQGGLFGVQRGALWGFIDTKGVTVIQPKYEAVDSFEGGVAPAKKNGLWGYITTTGKTDIPFDYSELGGREGKLFTAKGKDGWAIIIIMESGELYAHSDAGVIRYYSVSEGTIIAKVQGGEKLTFWGGGVDSIDLYLSIKRRSQGLSAASRTKDRWGYIDQDGEYLWPDRFEEAGPFSESLAPVKTAGKWGYIDRIGDFVVAPNYDAAFPFRDGLAVVRKGDLRGFLKNDPERGIYEFIKPTYQDALRFTEGLAPVRVGDKWGYVSSGKQPIIEDVVDIEPPQ